MKRTLIAACLLLPFLANVSHAKTLKLPTDKPSIQVTVPDTYKPEESDQGYTAESKDQAVTFYFEVTDAKDLKDLVAENIKYLLEQKVEIDQASQKERDFEANGFKVSELSYDGKQEGFGPETIKLFLIPLDNDKVFMITYWVTKKGEKVHESEITSIFNSVKKI